MLKGVFLSLECHILQLGGAEFSRCKPKIRQITELQQSLPLIMALLFCPLLHPFVGTAVTPFCPLLNLFVGDGVVREPKIEWKVLYCVKS